MAAWVQTRPHGLRVSTWKTGHGSSPQRVWEVERVQSPASHACHTAVMTGLHTVACRWAWWAWPWSRGESLPACWRAQTSAGQWEVHGHPFWFFFYLYILLIDFGERKGVGERHQFVTYAFIGWFSHDRGWNLQPWHIRTTLQPSSVLSLCGVTCPRGTAWSLPGRLPGGCSQSKKATLASAGQPLLPPRGLQPPYSQLTALWGEARTSGFPCTFILFI